jgi:hypothetical protein
MTPETAELGLSRFDEAKIKEPKRWSWKDYPDLKTMRVFNAKDSSKQE